MIEGCVGLNEPATSQSRNLSIIKCHFPDQTNIEEKSDTAGTCWASMLTTPTNSGIKCPNKMFFYFVIILNYISQTH